MPTRDPSGWHLAALAGLSAGMLAFEILLLRLFEFSHWHHFAGFAISLALLGTGAAGTTLALVGHRAVNWGDRWFLGALLVMALGLLLVVGLQSRIALRPLFATWDPGELGKLLLVDLAAFIPFYGAGLAIGQVFMRWPRRTRVLYAANLLGSGVGCVAAAALLSLVQAHTALVLIALAMLALGGGLALARRRRVLAAVCLGCLVVGLPLGWQAPAPAVSDFKTLARVQDLPDAEVLRVMPGLHGSLTVVRSGSLRNAPGLSLAWTEPVPAMDLVISGSDTEWPLPRRFPFDAPHARASLPGLPFLLRPDGHALVLGASAWQSPALAGPDQRVTWLHADRRLLELARERGARPPGFQGVADMPWRFLAVSPNQYPLILADQAYGLGDAASEDYLLTTEGLGRALQRLTPDGLLAIPLPVQEPPRHFPRVLDTVRTALARQGSAEPGDHIVALRGLQAQLLLVGREPLAERDIVRARDFADEWQFNIDWLPDLGADDTDQFHQTETPVFQQSARAILVGDVPLPEGARRFVTGPADVSRPYIWRSLDWSQAPGLVSTLGARGMAYLDWSLIFSLITVVTVTGLGFLLILAPLGRLPGIRAPFSRRSVAAYFLLLGLGYMLLEIAVLQRLMLLTAQPVLAATLVFASFLLGSGIGSLVAPEERSRQAALRVFGMVGVGLLVAVAAFWFAAERLLQPGLGVRLAVSALLMLPLAWALGRPFPWALRQLADQPHWIPWAWGINGFASVAAAALAPLISVHWGQPVTLGTGALCYLLAVVLALRWTSGDALRVQSQSLGTMESG